MAVSRFLVFCLLFLSTAASPSAAQRTTPVVDPAELLKSVVKITTTVPSDARTARGLGTSREGSGVVIDSSGLILTIGYLILEAETVDVGLHDGSTVAAETIAYDHDSGFGLLRATKKLDIKPASLGRSSIVEVRDRVLAVSHGGQDMTVPAMVVSRRRSREAGSICLKAPSIPRRPTLSLGAQPCSPTRANCSVSGR